MKQLHGGGGRQRDPHFHHHQGVGARKTTTMCALMEDFWPKSGGEITNIVILCSCNKGEVQVNVLLTYLLNCRREEFNPSPQKCVAKNSARLHVKNDANPDRNTGGNSARRRNEQTPKGLPKSLLKFGLLTVPERRVFLDCRKVFSHCFLDGISFPVGRSLPSSTAFCASIRRWTPEKR